MYKKILITVIILFLISCSKSKLKINCDNNSVSRQLLDSINLPNNGFLKMSLINLKLLKSNDIFLTCTASLKLQNTLNSRNDLIIPVKYKIFIKKVAFGVDSSKLFINGENTIKYLKWKNELDNYVAQLGDYQKTPYGSLYVLKDNFKQSLYFDGNLVKPEIRNNLILIEKNYLINDSYVFLIGSYNNATIDKITDNNFLIEIDKKSYSITQPFSYQVNGIQQKENSLYIIGSLKSKTYAEKDDFPIYYFHNGVLKTIKSTKPESYYQEKFAKLNSENIINQAIDENCYDSTSQRLILDQNCNYGDKYCYEFKYITDLDKNSVSYKTLEVSCSN